MDYTYLYLSTEGRIGRTYWWIGHLLLLVVSFFVFMILLAVFDPLSLAMRLISLIYVVAIAYPAYAVSAKRFQDRNRPGSLAAILIGLNLLNALLGLFGIGIDPLNPGFVATALGLIIPAVAIWYLIDLGILRGTVGDNKYGPDPVG